MQGQEAANVKLVQEAYAAFASGNVQGILDMLDDGVVWKGVYGTAAHVPMSGERRGKAQVGQFFKQVSESMNFSRFDPQEFVATGDKVVALGHYTATTAVGKPFDSDFAMVFTVRNGKITAFQEFGDSAAGNASFAPG